MLLEALNQVEKRLSESTNMFMGISLLNLKKVLGQTLREGLKICYFRIS